MVGKECWSQIRLSINDYTLTPNSVIQAKLSVPGKVHWTGPPHESSLSAMDMDTLNLPRCDRVGFATGKTLSLYNLLAAKEMRTESANCISGSLLR